MATAGEQKLSEDERLELARLRRENVALKIAPKGFQRDGLKADEVLGIAKLFGLYLNDGETEDVAFSLACRGTEKMPLVGIAAEVFKRWKPDIIKLHHGEPTPANSLLGATVDTEEQREKELRAQGRLPVNTHLSRRMGELGKQLDTLSEDHERVTGERDAAKEEIEKLRRENEDLKARAEALGIEEKQGGQLPPPSSVGGESPSPANPKKKVT